MTSMVMQLRKLCAHLFCLFEDTNKSLLCTNLQESCSIRWTKLSSEKTEVQVSCGKKNRSAVIAIKWRRCTLQICRLVHERERERERERWRVRMPNLESFCVVSSVLFLRAVCFCAIWFFLQKLRVVFLPPSADFHFKTTKYNDTVYNLSLSQELMFFLVFLKRPERISAPQHSVCRCLLPREEEEEAIKGTTRL